MSRLRTIDPCLPDESSNNRQQLTASGLSSIPARYDEIPAAARGLKDCAMYQINRLDQRAQSKPCSLSDQEEDALDDGFFICDLSVVEEKLRAWRRMFPRIKPFYALKCNPDAMVAAG